MIKAVFVFKEALILSATISGHALFAPKGQDIVCAAVSSQVALVELGLKGVLNDEDSFTKSTDSIVITVKPDNNEQQVLIKSLYLGLMAIQNGYPSSIQVVLE